MTTTLRAPAMAELVELIRAEDDEERRRFLESAYWAKAADRYGPRRAASYRWEYEWLVGR